MTALGWIAGGTLCTKVMAEAGSLADMLNYTTVAIAVCACCAALIALSSRTLRSAIRDGGTVLRPEVAALKLMAAQTPFAESRSRLLALVDRMERREP